MHVNVAPLIPALNDHEVPEILRAAADNGARSASFTIVRLPGAVADIFGAWLQEHYPERAGKVMHRIRGMRGGQVNETGFGSRMHGTGEYAEQIGSLFRVARRRYGLDSPREQLRTDLFRLPGSVQQPGLF